MLYMSVVGKQWSASEIYAAHDGTKPREQTIHDGTRSNREVARSSPLLLLVAPSGEYA